MAISSMMLPSSYFKVHHSTYIICWLELRYANPETPLRESDSQEELPKPPSCLGNLILSKRIKLEQNSISIVWPKKMNYQTFGNTQTKQTSSAQKLGGFLLRVHSQSQVLTYTWDGFDKHWQENRAQQGSGRCPNI